MAEDPIPYTHKSQADFPHMLLNTLLSATHSATCSNTFRIHLTSQPPSLKNACIHSPSVHTQSRISLTMPTCLHISYVHTIWGILPTYRCHHCPCHLLIILSTWVFQVWGWEKTTHLHPKPPITLIKALGWARGANSCIFTRTSLSPQLGPEHELGSRETSPGGSHSPTP